MEIVHPGKRGITPRQFTISSKCESRLHRGQTSEHAREIARGSVELAGSLYFPKEKILLFILIVRLF